MKRAWLAIQLWRQGYCFKHKRLKVSYILTWGSYCELCRQDYLTVESANYDERKRKERAAAQRRLDLADKWTNK